MIPLVSSHGEVLAETPAGMGRGRWCLSKVELQGTGLGTAARGRLQGYRGTRVVINND